MTFKHILLSLGAASLVASCPASGSPARKSPSDPADPKARIVRANEAARIQPERGGYFNAIQQYAWAEGALFQIYTAPGQVTDIVLQEGEELVGPGPVASGDTVRWIIGDTVSGDAGGRKVHILVKPTRADIMTNMVINTNRRTYHLELRATTSTYMAAVSWSYPQDGLIALKQSNIKQTSVAGGIDLGLLHFRYKIAGDKVAWRPVRVFDDGRKVFVEFANDIANAEMPPLFITGPGGSAELVNYRVQGRYMIVDRLFEGAELRLGAGKAARKVRLIRERSKS
jgi:type IV secretion system protein TrbG